MNREIKFRAWEENDSRMHYDVESGIYEDPDEIISFDRVLELACYEVMQYAGHKDKNGKEIYEGDILKASNNYTIHYYVVYYTYANSALICLPIKEYKDLMSELEEYEIKTDIDYSDMTEYCFSNMKLEHFEVAGNIYENPELLDFQQKS